MNTKYLLLVSLVSIAAVLGLAHCGSDETTEAAYTQVERLGRPGINEALVVTNAYLNAFNSVPPNIDLTSAATAILTEAGTTLTAFNSYATTNALTPAKVVDVVAGFVPDVMVVDTSKTIAVGSWAYNGSLEVLTNTTGTTTPAMLTGGRKIEDDVIDITLTYLLAGAANVTGSNCTSGSACAIPDGVSYSGGVACASLPGTNPANPGHKCLFGQSARNGTAQFPFLATPN